MRSHTTTAAATGSCYRESGSGSASKQGGVSAASTHGSTWHATGDAELASTHGSTWHATGDAEPAATRDPEAHQSTQPSPPPGTHEAAGVGGGDEDDLQPPSRLKQVSSCISSCMAVEVTEAAAGLHPHAAAGTNSQLPPTSTATAAAPAAAGGGSEALQLMQIRLQMKQLHVIEQASRASM